MQVSYCPICRWAKSSLSSKPCVYDWRRHSFWLICEHSKIILSRVSKQSEDRRTGVLSIIFDCSFGWVIYVHLKLIYLDNGQSAIVCIYIWHDKYTVSNHNSRAAAQTYSFASPITDKWINRTANLNSLA